MGSGFWVVKKKQKKQKTGTAFTNIWWYWNFFNWSNLIWLIICLQCSWYVGNYLFLYSSMWIDRIHLGIFFSLTFFQKSITGTMKIFFFFNYHCSLFSVRMNWTNCIVCVCVYGPSLTGISIKFIIQSFNVWQIITECIMFIEIINKVKINSIQFNSIQFVLIDEKKAWNRFNWKFFD